MSIRFMREVINLYGVRKGARFLRFHGATFDEVYLAAFKRNPPVVRVEQ